MAKNKTEERININKTQLENLLRLGFSRQQVCDFFGVAKNTLVKFVKENYGGITFEQLKAEHSAQLQANVMMNLLNISKRNAAAAIFLAKSVCGLNENYAAPVNDEAENEFTRALKKASRNISAASNLVSVPDVEEVKEDGEG